MPFVLPHIVCMLANSFRPEITTLRPAVTKLCIAHCSMLMCKGEHCGWGVYTQVLALQAAQ